MGVLKIADFILNTILALCLIGFVVILFSGVAVILMLSYFGGK